MESNFQFYPDAIPVVQSEKDCSGQSKGKRRVREGRKIRCGGPKGVCLRGGCVDALGGSTLVADDFAAQSRAFFLGATDDRRKFGNCDLVARIVSHLKPAFYLKVMPRSKGIFIPKPRTFPTVIMHRFVSDGSALRSKYSTGRT